MGKRSVCFWKTRFTDPWFALNYGASALDRSRCGVGIQRRVAVVIEPAVYVEFAPDHPCGGDTPRGEADRLEILGEEMDVVGEPYAIFKHAVMHRVHA